MEFETLKEEIKKCRNCQEKFGFEPHPVIFGNDNAKIFQISQAPSANVHLTLKPFTDLSGKKLKYEWFYSLLFNILHSQYSELLQKIASVV